VRHENAELFSELAVIAFLGFLEARDVLVELLLREERRAVDALHRLVPCVALPVRVRGREQLERLQTIGRWHVRTDAEVDERVAIFDRVAGHLGLAGRLLFDQLHLERFAACGEEVDRFLTRPHLPLVRQVLAGQLAHLGFDALQILGHERAIDDEVVEKPFIDGRTDPALRVGEERRHRGCHQMGGRVPIHVERFRRLAGDDLHARIAGERIGEVDELIVHLRDERGFGQTRRDLPRDREHRRPGRDRLCRSVRKRDCDLRHRRNQEPGIRNQESART
jgi:hypothetical protein